MIAKVEKLATKPMVHAQMVQWIDDDVAWWIESRATVHVCKDRSWFKTWNKKYFVTFLDDASRFFYVYLLHSKDEALDKFKVFKIEVELQQGSMIKKFRTDMGVARISTIRLLIALASIHSLFIHQMDVKIAFLNGELDKEDYMNQHYGFIMLVNENKVDMTKELLSSRFFIKDTEEADVILDIRIKHEIYTYMDKSKKLMPNNGQAVSQLKYSRVIGCLMYVMTYTRPNIAFAVGKLSVYTSIPGNQHWQAIKREMKNLKKTMDYSLIYTSNTSVLEGYTDASWISNTKENLSTSGWVFMLGGDAISWSSKKQTCITSSTMESKFMALEAAGKEAELLRNLIFKIPLWSKPISSISILLDSDATLAKAYNHIYNRKSRNLGVRHSMIHELIMNEVVSIEFRSLVGVIALVVGSTALSCCDEVILNLLRGGSMEGGGDGDIDDSDGADDDGVDVDEGDGGGEGDLHLLRGGTTISSTTTTSIASRRVVQLEPVMAHHPLSDPSQTDPPLGHAQMALT
nr:zinc finger, CCHC-type [Tanacetum cinerariifolium]